MATCVDTFKYRLPVMVVILESVTLHLAPSCALSNIAWLMNFHGKSGFVMSVADFIIPLHKVDC
jgi:hypothetical protein